MRPQKRKRAKLKRRRTNRSPINPANNMAMVTVVAEAEWESELAQPSIWAESASAERNPIRSRFQQVLNRLLARTEQKPKAPKKKPKEVATSDPFSHVELTGPQAKAESNP